MSAGIDQGPGRYVYDVRGTLPGSHPWNDARRRAWNGSWNGALSNPRTASAVSVMIRVIGAASALSAQGRTYGKEKVYGSIP